MLNLVGEKSVDLALKEEMIILENVKKIRCTLFTSCCSEDLTKPFA